MGNARCAICNREYEICNSCKNKKNFKPWRSVTDSIEHYKIYLAIHGYTVTKDKTKAQNELRQCNLMDSENFNQEIKSIINEIMEEPPKPKSASRTCGTCKKELKDISEADENDNE